MQSRFLALPVGQGDAFFYENDKGRVLIDGGKSVSFIGEMLRTALFRTECAEKPELDVLVCTHNDADHANGVLGILSSGIPCKEVWLPGRWTDRLVELLDDPFEFTQELLTNCLQLNDSHNEMTLAEYGDLRSTDITNQNEPLKSIDSVLNSIEKATDLEIFDWIVKSDYLLEYHFRRHFSDREKFLFFEALQAADRIKKIATAAFHAGSIIRWFDYNLPSVQDTSDILSPINCREILCTYNRKPNALEYLALTTANRESLVFAIKPKDELPGVIFSADSDFRFRFPEDFEPGDYIVTAPHHGSESNSFAYTKLDFMKEKGKLVRSDGNFRSRPGQSFMNFDKNRRYCTICRNDNNVKQRLDFHGCNKIWTPVNGLRSCHCQ